MDESDQSRMNWLVTGAAGYIGSNLSNSLVTSEINLRCTDMIRNSRSSFLESKGLHFSFGDLRDPNFVASLFGEIQINGVIHLAGLKSVAKSFDNRDEYFDTNVKATEILFEQAVIHGASRFLLASSAAIYDANAQNPINESTPVKPSSYYGETKVMAEKIVIGSSDIQSVALRFFNVVGSSIEILRDTSEDNVLPIFLKSMTRELSPRVFGNSYGTPDGSCIRDYVHVTDIVRVIKVLMASNKVLPKQLNIGSGTGISVLELISLINKHLRVPMNPIIVEPREGDVATVVADIGLLEEFLETKPTLTVEQALRDYLYDSQISGLENRD